MVITTTPAEDLEPYIALEAASFNTDMDLISDWFKKETSLVGTPSITYKTSFLPSVPSPLTRNLIPSPGAPVLAATNTPATCPCSAWATSTTLVFAKSPTSTVLTAPVIEVFFWLV